MQSELRLRIISGLVLAVITLGATWAGGTVFELLSVAIAVLVYYEWSTTVSYTHLTLPTIYSV